MINMETPEGKNSSEKVFRPKAIQGIPAKTRPSYWPCRPCRESEDTPFSTKWWGTCSLSVLVAALNSQQGKETKHLLKESNFTKRCPSCLSVLLKQSWRNHRDHPVQWFSTDAAWTTEGSGAAVLTRLSPAARPDKSWKVEPRHLQF